MSEVSEGSRKANTAVLKNSILCALLLLCLSSLNSYGFPCVYDAKEESSKQELLDFHPQCVLKVQTINRAGRVVAKTYVYTTTQVFANIIFCVGFNTYSVQHFKYPLHFRLECSADFPIEFEFNGLKPVDEISTYFYKTIKRNSERTISSYKVDIDFENKPKLTGRYIISSIVNSSLKTEFYFFMESNKEPFLLHNRNTEKAIINNNMDIAVLPCRTSNWNMSVLLYKVKRDNNELIKSAHFDPQQGFLFDLTKVVPEEGQYLCVIDKGHGTHGDSLIVSLILPSKNQESSLTKTKINIEVIQQNGALCTVDNSTYEFRPKSLINIKIDNPTQAKLQKECVFQGEYCLNTDQRVGGYESFCMCLAIHQLATQGIVMCATENDYIIQQHFTGLDGRLYCDSTQVPIPNSAVINIKPVNYTKIGNKKFYNYNAFEKYSFQCNISSYLLVKPIVWYRQLTNGTLVEEKINYDRGWQNREIWTDEITIEICPETVNVLCVASYWNNSLWVNSSLALTVAVRRKPKINASNPTILNFTAYQEVNIVCEADGYPTPKLTWFRNKHKFKPSYLIYKKVLELQFTRITPYDSGNYSCVAENAIGKDEVHFILNVNDGLNASKHHHDHDHNSDLAYQIAIRVPLGILIFLGVIFGSYWIVRHRKRTGLTRKEVKAFEKGTEIEMHPMSQKSQYAHESVESQPYNKDFEIHDNLHLEASVILGSGAYGVVLKGKFRGQSVAIKTVKAGADKMYLKALLSELKIMIHIGKHPNVITLLGAKTNELLKGILYIVVEYCPMGNLENVLRNQNRALFAQRLRPYENVEELENNEIFEINLEDRNSSCHDGFCMKDLVLWSYQIASAMDYLTSKKVIHGDLAARNVLLLNREIVKVTDFGLSRKLYDYLTYVKKQQEPLPWRWLAIEVLQSMSFSSKSDVWAFGVTLWEIFSLGDIPYPGLSWTVDFADQLENGLRLTMTKYASSEIYSLMQLCWANKPEDRPTFTELKKSFYLQLLRLSGDKYVELEANY